MLLVVYLAGAGRALAHRAMYALPADDDEDADALHLARELSEMLSPDDYFVTDSLMLAFAADRQVPPELINTSSWRIRTGHLNADQSIALTQDYEAAFTLPWSLAGKVAEGLQASHKVGIRFPIASNFDFEPVLPPSYQKLDEIWQEQEG